MRHLEELVPNVSALYVSFTDYIYNFFITTDRIVLWDAKVSHAWRRSATMPVQ